MEAKTWAILAKRLAGKRLTWEEGTALLREADLLTLGQAADTVREEMHPEKTVTFVIDRNINYTNICACRCRFCAFYRQPDDPDAYVLSEEELHDKIRETVNLGGTQLLIQGGLNPDLSLEYFENMLRRIKERFAIHIHSFSPPEIWDLARKSGLSIEEVIRRLKEAGLDSIPGGGAEILADRVRGKISPNKIGWQAWMDVMTTAHRLGMKTTATMMFGHVETAAERVLHMVRVREAQDVSGGFTAFIPWSFAPKNTELGGEGSTGVDYLRTLAVARLMLDNVPNLQASWVTQGAKMAQVALRFGANDFGSTMLEENVVRAAGVQTRVPLKEIVRCIEDAGYTAVQRNTHYETLHVYGKEV
ncbi:7,8-didemethyl-8-hydroxy-5-deazariboflavin synthase [Acididesulfobacillus acetoxydans]|uniref:Cyclic dehypoxanthine futalosine synthase n=1 Tax=Acididesulfobacillus acetoxydans TaxID=1561005 RepID=A0A8S0VXA0_9FIRM|nr:cyclic dehypoxanthinyl futalosine synthase [Acididesulfobacillus acetoxydans]CAA7601743.1 7,8-didemethyl-8-hydroxy-5-deazariboflavin synthase [Acididesulfobacillus acetoxydans]CEJ09038.1 FO synthase subunit 2 [Acididesulfobacillus acetoxydans]